MTKKGYSPFYGLKNHNEAIANNLRWFSGSQEADKPCKPISSVANKGRLGPASSFLFTHKASDREA